MYNSQETKDKNIIDAHTEFSNLEKSLSPFMYKLWKILSEEQKSEIRLDVNKK